MSNCIKHFQVYIFASSVDYILKNSKGERKMKKLQEKIVLISPLGKEIVPTQITYDDDEDAISPISEIDLIYNGIKYKGNGTDYLWVDTFADLQSKLPKAVKIACCMTCRYGNISPYGNIQNQLYCTKDLKIKSKEDMCNIFNGTDLDEEIKISSFNYCEGFVYQSNDYYTYNDYLYCLKKQK